MIELTLRGIPQKLYREIKAAATRNGHGLNEELLARLKASARPAEHWGGGLVGDSAIASKIAAGEYPYDAKVPQDRLSVIGRRVTCGHGDADEG